VWQADNVKIRDCDVSYAAFHGIYIGKGFKCEVTGSQVHHNILRNWPRGSSSSHDSGIAYYSGGNGVIRNNLVYLNNGEGLGCSGGWGEPGVAGLHILQNTVYDNWSVNIWIDHGSDVVIDGNFVYVSGNPPYPELPKSTPAGILCAEEFGFGQSGYLKNGIITNNIVTGCREGFGFWYDNPGSGLKDFLVAHNTFVDNKNGAMIIETGIHTGARILNNIFFQTTNILVTMAAAANVEFDYNSWYHQTNAAGIEWNGAYYTYDQWRQISGEGYNSQWTKPGFVAGKKFGTNQFRLISNSPCRDRGTIIATISRDYWGNSRPSGNASDIGAHEYRESAAGPLFLLLGD
jgi:hypothetical protein